MNQEFVWGAATSAYQIEGAALEGGRSPSIWDTFCRVPGAVDNGDTGDVACDHYHRWPEDIALMSRLGLTGYRFSIAWPRVLPDGTGTVNIDGLDFYDRFVDALLAAGIRPFATLYHWDLPQALQDRGGWPARDTARYLAEFAGVVGARLGDRIHDWFTLNEPLCSAWLGHLEGVMAPGIRDIRQAVPASHHLLLGHGLAAQALRATVSGPVRIGTVLNLSPTEPATGSDADMAAARRSDGHSNRWFLDPLYGRGYPADMIDVYQVEPPVLSGDLEVIAVPTDHIGVNYYFRSVVADEPAGDPPYATLVPQPQNPVTAMGWEVYPDGLEQILRRVADEYPTGPIYVTESGSAYHDEVLVDGRIEDKERTAYLEDHVAAVERAAAAGAPMAGYFVWSLLDNLEWAYGYAKRFGMVYVDYETQRRTVKLSGQRYAEMIRAHRAGAAPAG
jgi:beta-glucosidase